MEGHEFFEGENDGDEKLRAFIRRCLPLSTCHSRSLQPVAAHLSNRPSFLAPPSLSVVVSLVLVSSNIIASCRVSVSSRPLLAARSRLEHATDPPLATRYSPQNASISPFSHLEYTFGRNGKLLEANIEERNELTEKKRKPLYRKLCFVVELSRLDCVSDLSWLLVYS
ncbi:hypothetical protein PIB30_088885 [Stylosanthes scabra]|uniref:Uncharacterized protein n=1 Tax=Stylosanthes scabra TaxID=79078 RepID=A0ABU6XSX8_9FABA|nr:hypothetical protein [Stylosanthes scabra]